MTVRLTIDGNLIEADDGLGLLQTARQNGLTIPTLCYHRDLTPTGNCRICVVEVQGQRFLQAACVTSVWEEWWYRPTVNAWCVRDGRHWK